MPEKEQEKNKSDKKLSPTPIRKSRKVRTGEVVSNKSDKTIVVKTHRIVKHPLYGKFVRKTNKLAAHDEKNTCNIGDIVKVMETRRLSKKKCWRLLYTLKKTK